jgi:hypothetical protein
MQSSIVHKALFQMSYGFCTQVHCYGCYDVNGYRFHSEQYENGRSGLTTCNTGVSVSSYDESGNVLDYYGVIEDIIKIVWEGACYLSWFYFIAVGLIQHPMDCGALRTWVW